MIKRYTILIFCILSICSCDKLFNKNDIDQYKAELEKIQEDQLDNFKSKVNEQINESLKEAESLISSSIEKALKAADSSLQESVKVTIDEAISSTKEQINKTVEELISKEKDTFEVELKKAHKMTLLAFLSGLLGIIVGATSIILNNKKRMIYTLKCSNEFWDTVIENVGKSSRIEEKIKTNCQQIVSKSRMSYSEEQLIDLITSTIESNKDIIISWTHSKDQQEPIIQQNKTTEVKRTIRLFAKDTTSNILSDLTNTFQPGKSIYVLDIDEHNPNIAEVSLYLDDNNTKQRIITNGKHFLGQICTLDEKKANGPRELYVETTGKAEKNINDNTWTVTKQIKAEIK